MHRFFLCTMVNLKIKLCFSASLQYVWTYTYSVLFNYFELWIILAVYHHSELVFLILMSCCWWLHFPLIILDITILLWLPFCIFCLNCFYAVDFVITTTKFFNLSCHVLCFSLLNNSFRCKAILCCQTYLNRIVSVFSLVF